MRSWGVVEMDSVVRSDRANEKFPCHTAVSGSAWIHRGYRAHLHLRARCDGQDETEQRVSDPPYSGKMEQTCRVAHNIFECCLSSTEFWIISQLYQWALPLDEPHPWLWDLISPGVIGETLTKRFFSSKLSACKVVCLVLLSRACGPAQIPCQQN